MIQSTFFNRQTLRLPAHGFHGVPPSLLALDFWAARKLLLKLCNINGVPYYEDDEPLYECGPVIDGVFGGSSKYKGEWFLYTPIRSQEGRITGWKYEDTLDSDGFSLR